MDPDVIGSKTRGMWAFVVFSALFFATYLVVAVSIAVHHGYGTGIGDGRNIHTIDGRSPLHAENPQP